MHLKARRTGRKEAEPIGDLESTGLNAVSSRGNCEMKRIETVVDDFASVDSLRDRENVADEVAKHIDVILPVMCCLTALLRGKE